MAFKASRYAKPKYALLFILLLIVLSVISESGLRRMIDVSISINREKEEIERIKKDIEKREKMLNEMQKNPRLIETYARDNLGLIRPDELVYEVNR